jgi:TPR repeat protein
MNMIRDINTKKLVKALSILTLITTISGCSHFKKTQQYFHSNTNNNNNNNNNSSHSSQYIQKTNSAKNTQDKSKLSVFSTPDNKINKSITNNTNKELKISHQDHIKLKQVELDARTGTPEAQWKLGMIYFKGLAGVQEDNDIAFTWIKKSASQKYPPAEYMIGFFYEHGIGTTKDNLTANMYYKLAKQKGFKIKNQSKIN